MKTKSELRVMIIADMHCGHLVGLTPPAAQLLPLVIEEDIAKHHRRQKWIDIQRALWADYEPFVKGFGPVDVLIINGDAIDGDGSKSGGTELITTNRLAQVDIATVAIQAIKADKIFMTFGTSYHTGKTEDFESVLCKNLKAEKIGAHEWFDIRGVHFDVKHFIGGSNIPHGRATPLLRDALWNMIWAARDEQPKADVIIRSHVHNYMYVEDADVTCINTPALQGMGSTFGSRICSRTVDWGLIGFDIKDRNNKHFWKHIIKIREQKAKEVKIA